jgi:hypothetical protein
MIVNAWIALRDTAQSAIKTRLNWDTESQGEYAGPVTDRQAKLFGAMQDHNNTQRLFRVDNDTQDWTLWNVYLQGNLAAAKAEIDQILIDYPAQVRVIGAWWFHDGAQVGTENVWSTRTVEKTWSVLNPDYQPDDQEPNFDPRFVLRITGDVDEDYVSGFTGTAEYPIHARILELMPDLDDIGTRPTEPSDVNLGLGQSPRWFG